MTDATETPLFPDPLPRCPRSRPAAAPPRTAPGAGPQAAGRPPRAHSASRARAFVLEAGRALACMAGFVAFAGAWTALSPAPVPPSGGYAGEAMPPASSGAPDGNERTAPSPGSRSDEPPARPSRTVPTAPATREAPPPELWLVDGYNVIQVALLAGADRAGWWRASRREALLDCVRRFPDPRAEIVVVFDGSDCREDVVEPARLRVVFHPSADSWILDRLRADPRPAGPRVVTADRSLAARASRRGALVMAPGPFLSLCAAGDAPCPAPDAQRPDADLG